MVLLVVQEEQEHLVLRVLQVQVAQAEVQVQAVL